MGGLSTTYPIEVFCSRRRRWYRARYYACWETFPADPFRIVGPPRVITTGGHGNAMAHLLARDRSVEKSQAERGGPGDAPAKPDDLG